MRFYEYLIETVRISYWNITYMYLQYLARSCVLGIEKQLQISY